jgi:hypothetical protein
VQQEDWGGFRLRLPVLLQFASGAESQAVLDVSAWSQIHEVQAAERPLRVILDPDDTLLMSVSRLEP